MVHDRTYESVPVYKKYSDKKYSNALHKAILTAFVASLVLFTGFQYAWPFLSPFKATPAQASAPTYTWSASGANGLNFTNELDNSTLASKNITSTSTNSTVTNYGGDLGTGADCDVVIVGTVNIQALYENSSVTGANLSGCAQAGNNKGLNHGVSTYKPSVKSDNTTQSSVAIPNFNSLTIASGGSLTTNAGIMIDFKVLNSPGLTIQGALSKTIAASGGASRTGTTATITTTTAHGLYVGQTVTVAGNSNAVFNGTFVVTTVPTSTTFTYTTGTSGSASGNNGTVTAGEGQINATAAGEAGGVSDGNGQLSPYGGATGYGGGGGAYGPIFPDLGNGGGGGGSASPDSGSTPGGAGGNGGGSVKVAAVSASLSGHIYANGGSGALCPGDGSNDNASGGGGSGGSVYVISQSGTVDATKISAIGGAGGVAGSGGYCAAGDPGGGGQVTVAGVSSGSASVGGGVFNTTTAPGPGYIGFDGSSTYKGLQFNNGAAKARWIDLKYKGNVPTGATVQFQARPSDTLGSGTFYDPATNTASTWSATVPAGTDYTTTGYTLAISASLSMSKTMEVAVKMTGTTSSPTIVSLTLDYDSLDAPINLNVVKHTGGGALVSASGNHWTNEASVDLKADVVNMSPVPSETIYPQIELISPSSGSFSSPSASGSYFNGSSLTTSDGGVTYTGGGITFTPANYGYAGAASAINFGQISGLVTNMTYKVQLRFTDLSGRLGPWNSSVTLNIFASDQTAPSVSSLAYNSGANSSQNSTIVAVTMSGSDAASGVNASGYNLEYQQAPLALNSPSSWGSWTQAGTLNASASPFLFTGADGYAYKFRVSAADNVGNRSTVTTGSNWVGVDTTAPTGTISVNTATPGYTSSSSVVLTTTGNENSSSGSGLAYMQFSNDGSTYGTVANAATGAITDTSGSCTTPKYWDGTSCWVANASSFSGWNLGSAQGAHNVYGHFRDNAGNIGGSFVFNYSSSTSINIPGSVTSVSIDIKGGGGGGAGSGYSGNAGGNGGDSSIKYNNASPNYIAYGGAGGSNSKANNGGTTTQAGFTNTAAPAVNGANNAGAGAGYCSTDESGPNPDGSAGGHISGTLTMVNGVTGIDIVVGGAGAAGTPGYCGGNSAGGVGSVQISYGTSTISTSIVFDNVAPTTTGSITAGTLGSNGWYTTNVTYTITPADATSGVASTVYCTDTTGSCTPGTPYTSALTLSTQSATNHVRWKSTDNAGLVQTVQDSGAIKVDKTNPTTAGSVTAGTLGANGWYTTNVTYTITPADATSGVASTVYCTDTTNTCTPGTAYSSALTITNESATNYVRWSSTDSAGLVQAVQSSGVVKIDKVNPTTTGSVTAGTLGLNSWYTTNVIFTLVPVDAMSGINSTAYCVDTTGSCSPSTSYSSPVTISNESATNHIRWFSTDNAGLMQTVQDSGAIKVDKTNPTTAGAVTSGTLGANSWYTSNVTFTLTPTDATSGIASTVYCIDTAGSCTPGTSYNSALTLSTESGSNHVRWKSTDTAGNAQPVQDSGSLAIDKTNPTTPGSITAGTPGSNGWYTTNVIFTITPTDATSGVNSTAYCIDTTGTCSPSTSYTTALTISNESATNHIRWFSMDNAGLTQTIQDSGVIKVDKTNPTTPGSITGGINGLNGWYTSNVTFTIVPTDATSGIASTVYCTDTTGTCTPGAVYSTALTLASESATNHIRWNSIDNAGNAQAVQDSGIIKIDKTAPTAPAGATILAWTGWNQNYISNTNKAAVQVSGSKSSDTVQIKIDITDGTNTKTTTLSNLDTSTAYADPTGIDTTAAPALSDGNIGITITASDVAGNTSTQVVTKASGAFVRDTVMPYGTVYINNLGDTATNNPNSVNLTLDLHDDLSGVSTYQLKNGTDSSWSAAADISSSGARYQHTVGGWSLEDPSTEGRKTVLVQLTDKAGNMVNSISNWIAYDHTIPSYMSNVTAKSDDNSVTLSTNGPSQGWYPFQHPNFSFNATDDVSGVQKFRYCFLPINNATLQYPACTFTDGVDATTVNAVVDDPNNSHYNLQIDMSAMTQTKYRFTVEALDYAGNASVSTSYDYYYDHTPPTAVNGFSATKGVDANNNPLEDRVRLTWDKPTVIAGLSPQAPVVSYKVERVLASELIASDGSFVVDYDGDWFGQRNTNLTSYAQIILDVSSLTTNSNGQYQYDDLSMIPSVKYVYRITARDASFGTDYGDKSQGNDLAVYGYTKDSQAPEYPPTNVTANACDGKDLTNCSNSDPTKKGKEVKVTWLPATDLGTGVASYNIYRREGGNIDQTGWSLVGNVPETSDSLLTLRVFWDETVLDAKMYSYRITAIDAAAPPPPNETKLFLSNDVQSADYTSNASPLPTMVPDITPPAIPTTFSVTASGIDNGYDCTDEVTGQPTTCYHQRIVTNWSTTTDNTADSPIAYNLYTSATPNPDLTPFSLLDTTSTGSSYTQNGLSDKTTYYYYITVTDQYGNMARSSVKSATTGDSNAPTTPSGIEVHNDEGVSDAAHQLELKFRGSYAKGCDGSTGTDCISSYQPYYALTNISPDTYNSASGDTKGLATPNDPTDDCNLSVEKADDCWVRINHAQPTQTLVVNPPKGDERNAAKHVLVVANLTESTKYYVRVKAIDNHVGDEGPRSSLLSAVYDDAQHIHTGGWDITRDLTAPNLPSPTSDNPNGGLQVKVHDTYPNSSVLRNIVTWRILDQAPLRPKLSYEKDVSQGGNCKTVIQNGQDYCNDFGRFEIYRQILDSSNNVIEDSGVPIATITNPETNFYIDEIGKNQTIEGMTGGPLLVESQIKYYVKVSDDSYDKFLYPDGSRINIADNKTSSQFSADNIVPLKATPALATGTTVTISDVGVTTAMVHWVSDQPTDSLVQYRPMKQNSLGGWESDDSSNFVTVGQVDRVPNHDVRLFGLLPNTRYEYRLVSRNYLDNQMTYDVSVLPVIETQGFRITPGDVESTTTGAVISWTTNMDASSAFVEYQMQAQPGDTPIGGVAGPTLDQIKTSPRSFKANVTGVKSGRTYNFKIKSVSVDGYLAEYPNDPNKPFNTFTTPSFDTSQFSLAPASSNVADKNITSTTAQIVWQTATPSTSWVDYGTVSGTYATSAGDNNLSTTHVVNLTGLVPGTKYYYKVRVEDANNVVFNSKEYTFVAVVKPKISNLRVTDVTPYTATIGWDTNVDTETVLNWGTTSAYGEKKGTAGKSQVHQVVIENLEDNTEYHYQIVAHDEAGNEVVGEDEIVRTPLDTEGPKITGVKTDIMPLGDSDTTAQVIVSWVTNKPATTKVEYDEGIIGGRYTKSSTEDDTLNTSHTVIIKGLNVATTYHYRIVTKDKRGNVTTSNDYTYVTPSKEQSIWQLIVKSLQDTFSWTKNLGNLFKRR